MQNELTCNQVIALMSFYVEDKINTKLKKYVDDHLKKCSKCREIYLQSQKISAHILKLASDNDNSQFHTKQYEEFRDKLSAYIDNELDENESIRIKKIAISNPLARKDLENMYSYKQIMHQAFNKTKNEFKGDYSKLVLNQLGNKSYKIDPLKKIVIYFIGLISILIIGLVTTLYS